MNVYQEKIIALIAGSSSTEHDVSLVSAATIYSAIRSLKRTVYPLYLNKENQLFLLDVVGDSPYQNLQSGMSIRLEPRGDQLLMVAHNNLVVSEIDIFFPAMHGRMGEDGTIQGYLDLLAKPYVGSGLAASALAMDKEFTKIILRDYGVASAPHLVFYKDAPSSILSFERASQQLEAVALFVKPVRSGSSLGISKVERANQWQAAMDLAFMHDNKILIEPALKVRELEIAILDEGNEIFASRAGEISYEQGFYDYDQKYSSQNQTQLIIPSAIDESILAELQQKAIVAHRALGCKSLSRVDFFLTESGEILLNEINTMPGFTSLSMYPMLMQASGLTLESLVQRLLTSGYNSIH
jgi:D-alanine-D-alanine ligase